MIYRNKQSRITGVFELFPQVFGDHRGTITKTFYRDSYQELGLECEFGESLVTNNIQKDVLRGFHFQRPPYCQAKTLYCVTGSFFDAVIDLRVGSPTYGQTDVFELSAEKSSVLYLPRGVANCYLITHANTIITYNLTSRYMPEYDGGIRWDSVGLVFPVGNPIVSEKDAALPQFGDFTSPFIYGD